MDDFSNISKLNKFTLAGIAVLLLVNYINFACADTYKSNNAVQNADIIANQIKRQKFTSTAKEYLGTPYRYGGLNKHGIDCSGFVYKTAKIGAGIQLPRSSYNMAKIAEKISLKDAKLGDLVFFAHNNRIFHVGIYLGNGKFIHASKSSGVIISKLSNPYWKKVYAFTGRIIH